MTSRSQARLREGRFVVGSVRWPTRFARAVLFLGLGSTIVALQSHVLPTRSQSQIAPFLFGSGSSWKSLSRRQDASSNTNRRYAHFSTFETLTNWKEDWGVRQNPDADRIPFPDSLESLAQSIVRTIHAELSPPPGQVDPNMLHNAMQGDTVLGRRPARYPDRDRGRMGIEIEGEDLTLVALRTASALCREPKVPVVVYFNTMNEGLVASRYLHIIRSKENNDPDAQALYDLIQISVLHSSTKLPDNMSGRQKRNQKIDPSRGYVIVVQPVGPIEGMQRIVSRATLQGLPVILISPRMNHFTPTPWDQSGFQQSEFYGGCEPPRGPTPWLLRDFTPPILSWIVSPDGFSLWQTIRHKYHCWDIFLRPDGGDDDDDSLQYLASTSKVAGRPTRWLLDRLARSVISNE